MLSASEAALADERGDRKLAKSMRKLASTLEPSRNAAPQTAQRMDSLSETLEGIAGRLR
jgi:hypothetical protein